MSVLAATGFFCVVISSCVDAQQRISSKPSDRYEHVGQEEGARRLESFRGQRLEGDYCFRFELEHLPRRGKKSIYYGTMWGSWNDAGPITRIQLSHVEDDSEDIDFKEVDLIIQNGSEPGAWLSNGGGVFQKLKGEALFVPVIPGVNYSPFDLQMPFLYWDSFVYEGPGRVQSRVAQRFLMQPPEGSVATERGIEAVRVCLDDAYDALLRVEVLDSRDEEKTRFTVESFKKVQGQYIVKEVTLKDYETKDRTRFRVKAASVGMLLGSAMFDWSQLIKPVNISESMFEEL
ncbi:MAG: hypothetical protein ACSHYA_07055 [Opitutaceae bacterium]